MFLVKPGTKSAPLLLTDVLREQHEEHRKRVQKDQALRKASGAPLTDDGSPPPILSEYEAPEHLEGVQVVFRVVSEAERQRLFGLVRASAGDTVALQKAFAEVLQSVLCEVSGDGESVKAFDDDDNKPSQAFSVATIGLLADNLLLVPIAEAALHFLSLPPKKALRCGQPAPRISALSNALGAENHSVVSEAVVAELEPAIFVAPITRPTLAHADT